MNVAGHHPYHTEVAKHRFQLVQVTGFSAEAHALQRRSSGSLEVPLEDRLNGPRLHQLDCRGEVIETRGDPFGFLEIASRRLMLASQVLGGRRYLERLEKQR